MSASIRLHVMFWVAAVSGQTGHAQELLGVIDGGLYDSISRVERFSDLDLDGVPDFLLGYQNGLSVQTPFVGTGAIVVVSGQTLLPLVGPVVAPGVTAANDWFDRAGDFNGDGVEDFCRGFVATSGPVPPQFIVYSGLDGSVLQRVHDPGVNDWGASLAPLGDVDGDGFDDLILGEEYDDEYYVVGGPDAHIIRHHPGRGSRFCSVASLGDLDGDLVPDYGIGYPGIGVYLHSGATGAVLGSTTEPWLDYGVSLAGLGDIDGDNVPDFAVGAMPLFWTPHIGRVYVYSGATRQRLFEFAEDSKGVVNGRGFGRWLDGGQDVNGDGVRDLAITASGGILDQESVEIYSMRTGARIAELSQSTFPAQRFWHAALLGDLDGDGDSEWAFADPEAWFGGTRSGRLNIFRGGPGDAERICPPTGTGAAALGWNGPLRAGHPDQRFTITDGPPQGLALVFWGLEGPALPLGSGTLCIAAPLRRLGAPLALDAQGSGTLAIDPLLGPQTSGPFAWTPGTEIVAQAVHRHPSSGGLATTDGWRILFTP